MQCRDQLTTGEWWLHSALRRLPVPPRGASSVLSSVQGGGVPALWACHLHAWPTGCPAALAPRPRVRPAVIAAATSDGDQGERDRAGAHIEQERRDAGAKGGLQAARGAELRRRRPKPGHFTARAYRRPLG